jgi:predicted small secreted protein
MKYLISLLLIGIMFVTGCGNTHKHTGFDNDIIAPTTLGVFVIVIF